MLRELKIKNRKSRIADRYKGLTFTEVVVASALLLIVLVPILKALTSVHVTDTIIERKTCSLILAQAKLDDIRARALLSFPANGAFDETGTSLQDQYLCNVTDTAIPGYFGHRKIIVEVGYDNNSNGTLDGDEVGVELGTIVTKREYPLP